MNLNIVPFRQQVATQRPDDVAHTVRAGLNAVSLSERVRPGMRIAVGVGSRGIALPISLRTDSKVMQVALAGIAFDAAGSLIWLGVG